MNTLPQLSTGAILQYPYVCKTAGVTRTLQLADGSEQRFVLIPPRKAWTINLCLLQEQEKEAFLTFAQEAMRSREAFCFTDPQDGRVYPACRIAIAPVTDFIDAVGRTGVLFMIAEVQP